MTPDFIEHLKASV